MKQELTTEQLIAVLTKKPKGLWESIFRFLGRKDRYYVSCKTLISVLGRYSYAKLSHIRYETKYGRRFKVVDLSDNKQEYLVVYSAYGSDSLIALQYDCPLMIIISRTLTIKVLDYSKVRV